jgi:hypothetical protein
VLRAPNPDNSCASDADRADAWQWGGACLDWIFRQIAHESLARGAPATLAAAKDPVGVCNAETEPNEADGEDI